MKKLNLGNNNYLKVKIKDTMEGKILTISGYVQGQTYGLYGKYGGQCQDVIEETYIGPHSELSKEKQKMLSRLIEIWNRYHLNNMNAGTERQMKALEGKNLSYEDALEYLKSINLKIDDGYEYGTAWLFEEIPAHIFVEIDEIAAKWETSTANV